MRQKQQAYTKFLMTEGLQEEFLDWMDFELGGNDGNE